MRRAGERAPSRDDGQIEITVSVAGEVVLPPPTLERLRLAPDYREVEEGMAVLRLEVSRNGGGRASCT